MRFQPLSESELKPPLLEKGEYDAELLSAEDKTSDAGNSMIHLLFKVYGPTGKSFLIHDYLVFVEGLAYKVRHFCYMNGLQNEYEAGFLSADICKKIRSLRVKVGIKVDKTGQYDDKNVIIDYLENVPGQAKAKTEEPFVDDDLPF